MEKWWYWKRREGGGDEVSYRTQLSNVLSHTPAKLIELERE